MRLVGSELLKLRTTPRTVLGLLLALLAIIVLGSIGTLASADGVPGQITLLDVLSIAQFADIFALILGVLVVTWEYRHDTITQTFLIVPRREQVIAAKAAAAVTTGIVLAVVSVGVALTFAFAWIGGDPGVSFDGDVWERAARLVLSSGLYGALGVGLGAIVRSQALAIVLVFVWFLVVEPLVTGLYDEVGRYLPGAAITELAGQSGSEPHLGIGMAVTMALLYCIGFPVLGAILTVRRDVT